MKSKKIKVDEETMRAYMAETLQRKQAPKPFHEQHEKGLFVVNPGYGKKDTNVGRLIKPYGVKKTNNTQPIDEKLEVQSNVSFSVESSRFQ